LSDDDGHAGEPQSQQSPLDDDTAAADTSTLPVSVSAPAPEKLPNSSQVPRLRRSRRRPLNVDALAYKPEEKEEEDSADGATGTKRAKSSKRGTKRRWTHEEASSSIPKAKKSRLRKSVSTADAATDEPVDG